MSQDEKKPRAYLRTDQIAQVYNVSPSTIRRWVDEGRFAPHELGPRKGRAHNFIPPSSTSTTAA